MTTVQDVTQETPLMKQYGELKAQAGDALLFFRMGDFYELFGDDAIEASRLLAITLTSRDRNKPNPTPMAGVPHHSAQGYIQRLLKAGKKVAIGEQMEDPSKVSGKNIVKRELVRIFTPGVQFDLESAEANYIAAVIEVSQASANAAPHWVLACLDASTGEALVSEPLLLPALLLEINGLPIRHLLRPASDVLDAGFANGALPSPLLMETLPSNYLAPEQALETLKHHYELAQMDAFVTSEAGVHALGTVVTYALRSQKQERLDHLRLPVPLHRPSTMVLGPRTPQHLDLLPGVDAGQSLFSLINRTRSSLGARCLKRWLLEPLCAPAEIFGRQEAIRELSESATPACEKISTCLAQVYDLERIAGRVNARLANPRDTLALGRSLATLPELAAHLVEAESPLLKRLHQSLIELSNALFPLGRQITDSQKEDAPLVAREGGIFNWGTNKELDRLLSLTEDGQKWLIELETREREATGIPSLKVRYNRVFGYYIEITQSHLKNAPSHYQRKQTTVGAERFFTEELKKFEDEIVNASARQRAMEQELFEELLTRIREHTRPIMDAARILGEVDSLVALARLAQEPGWVFPEINDSFEMEITDGRHPLVDSVQGAARGRFVPNDLRLGTESQLSLIITGPNMGGKSTVMRQTALIVILGQMGAPVPASQARWGVVSRLYTRIGAHDAISRGQSTFMVEMSELAHILHHADERSLIVLDEIGRGTSTYDGISVAWSTLEWISHKIRARTLFATHYHELTQLASELPLVANAHMAVEGTRAVAVDGSKKIGVGLRFLYKLKDGPAQESFGVHVARIAGLPKPVVERAWEVLEELERNSFHGQKSGQSGQSGKVGAASRDQLSLFSQAPRASQVEMKAQPIETPVLLALPPHPAIVELEKTNINEMTPLQALNFVVRLQEISRGSPGASV
jgi:DNA mismatch repair protein MutS